MSQKQEWFEMMGKTIPKESLLTFLDDHPELLEYTLQLSILNHQPQSWRSVWLVKLSTTKNDPQVIPYLGRMIAALPGKSDGHQRELMNVILKMDWSEEQEGILFDACLEICGSISKSPSVRVVAFRILSRIIANYPELWYEIQFIVEEEYLETLSAGIRNGFKRDLKALQRLVLPKL